MLKKPDGFYEVRSWLLPSLSKHIHILEKTAKAKLMCITWQVQQTSQTDNWRAAIEMAAWVKFSSRAGKRRPWAMLAKHILSNFCMSSTAKPCIPMRLPW